MKIELDIYTIFMIGIFSTTISVVYLLSHSSIVSSNSSIVSSNSEDSNSKKIKSYDDKRNQITNGIDGNNDLSINQIIMKDGKSDKDIASSVILSRHWSDDRRGGSGNEYPYADAAIDYVTRMNQARSIILSSVS